MSTSMQSTVKVRSARAQGKGLDAPQLSRHELARIAYPSHADPLELALALAASRFLTILGRLPESNDFIERSLLACRGLFIWSAKLITALQAALGSAASAGASNAFDDDTDNEHDEASINQPSGIGPSWQCLVDPDRVQSVRPGIFRRLNADAGLRRALGKATLEWAATGPTTPIPALANARYMAETFGLGDAGRRLIELIILAELSYEFEDALNQLELGKRHEVERILGLYLGCDQREVARLVGRDGILARIGLIDSSDGGGNVGFLLATGLSVFAQGLTQEHASAEDFLESFLMLSPPPKLDDADTEHLSAIKQLATPLLRTAAEQAVPGTNLMFYGAPGTGKTELARQVAARAGLRLYEVRYAGPNGSSLSAQQRLASLLLSLHALRGKRDAAILLDEAEDIFSSCERNFWGPPSKDSELSKAWITRLLEENQIPVLWTSNRVRQIDPAVLRRFVVMYEFSELPQSVKRRLADKFLGGMDLGEPRMEQVARLRQLVPAQLENAANAAALVKPASPDDAWQCVRLQLNESRRAMGQAALVEHTGSPVAYDAGCLNLGGGMDTDLLLAGLRRNGRAALCFHGVPGTGKTELARYLARQLERELVVQSGSDLLSMWLGETEKRIADMFARAGDRASQVLLLLDEADTFLKDRSKATASWELSQTNEFLARMEGFPGIFICTTNLIDRLDTAVLRRFQFRVEFRGMRFDQSQALFRSAFGREPTEPESRAMRLLDGKLAPADFSNVARQLAFLGEVESQPSLVDRLADECRSRGVTATPMRSIGFVH